MSGILSTAQEESFKKSRFSISFQGAFVFDGFFGIPSMAASRVLALPSFREGLLYKGHLFLAGDFKPLVKREKVVGIKDTLINSLDGPAFFMFVDYFIFQEIFFEEGFAFRATGVKKFGYRPMNRRNGKPESPNENHEGETTGYEDETVMKQVRQKTG